MNTRQCGPNLEFAELDPLRLRGDGASRTRKDGDFLDDLCGRPTPYQSLTSRLATALGREKVNKYTLLDQPASFP